MHNWVTFTKKGMKLLLYQCITAEDDKKVKTEKMGKILHYSARNRA